MVADGGGLSLAKSCSGVNAEELSEVATSNAADCERNVVGEGRSNMERNHCEEHNDCSGEKCGHPVTVSPEGYTQSPAPANTTTFFKGAAARNSMRASPREHLQVIGQKLRKTHSLRIPFRTAAAVLSGGSGSDQQSDVKAEGRSKSESSEAPVDGSLPGESYSSMRSFLSRVIVQIHLLQTGTDKRKLDMLEERIAEWKRRFEDAGSVPGVVGIRNHGNTCFINAILQCLSYTDMLAE
jgi:hypothetical protein